MFKSHSVTSHKVNTQENLPPLGLSDTKSIPDETKPPKRIAALKKRSQTVTFDE